MKMIDEAMLDELDCHDGFSLNDVKIESTLVENLNENLNSFPVFRPLEIRDFSIIEEVTKDFKPLSAIVFSCLFCWGKPYEISFIHRNVVLRNQEAISGEVVYTLLGENNIADAINAIFSFQEKYQLKRFLKFIPEEMIQNKTELAERFSVEVDDNNSDYIYHAKNFSKNFSASNSHHKNLNYFKNHYPEYEFEVMNFSHENAHLQIYTVFAQWKIDKNKTDKDAIFELEALKKLKMLVNYFCLKVILLKVDGQAIGFSVSEFTAKSYIVIHFFKVVFGYKGAEEMIFHKMAEICMAEGCEHMNLEEDMGFEGLREHKLTYHPEFMIRSYTISPLNHKESL